jgi:hypothetical protein
MCRSESCTGQQPIDGFFFRDGSPDADGTMTTVSGFEAVTCSTHVECAITVTWIGYGNFGPQRERDEYRVDRLRLHSGDEADAVLSAGASGARRADHDAGDGQFVHDFP